MNYIIKEINYDLYCQGSVSKRLQRVNIKSVEKWGVLYHVLNIGEKPDFDILIDDKAKSDTEFLINEKF